MTRRAAAVLLALTVGAVGAVQGASSELAGTAWRLVNIASMDDTDYVPDKPAAPLAAVVLGEEVRTSDEGEMQDIILNRLFDQYAAAHDLAAEPTEIDAFVENLKRGMAAEGLKAADDLGPEERAELDTIQREMGAALIRHWKINKSLYLAYGGRIIYQQLGPEPLDAYRQYLEDRQQAGDFTIKIPAMAESFWRYFTDDSIHDFMEPGGEDAARAFTTPPWEEAR